MEALKSLNANVPDWLKKLDELNGQIEQRQIELAKLTGDKKTDSPDGRSPGAARSVRNKGSTESLKPRDEPEAHPHDPVPQLDADNGTETAAAAAAAAGAAAAKSSTEQRAPPSPSDSQSPSALQRQASQMRAAGQARARATLRKRQRTDSVISAEGAAPKYRTRSMIIVYYDSYVQMFFEELVKFVSASRNMMRKAKMAAKIAQIKRLAELEMPDDDAEGGSSPTAAGSGTSPIQAGDGPIAAAPTPSRDGTQDDAEEPIHALHFVSTRRFGPRGYVPRTARNNSTNPHQLSYTRAGAGRAAQPPTATTTPTSPSAPTTTAAAGPGGRQPPAAGDVYDELDQGLEYVQSMCEHAAHQFLRDGDCAEEVANIKRRLAETKELADREMARVRREEPGKLAAGGDGGMGGGVGVGPGGEEDGEGVKGRSYRPQSMRRDGVKSPGGGGAGAGAAASASAAAIAAASAAAALAGSGGEPLEVDEGVEDVDGEEMPKLVYKSTRRMRP